MLWYFFPKRPADRGQRLDGRDRQRIALVAPAHTRHYRCRKARAAPTPKLHTVRFLVSVMHDDPQSLLASLGTLPAWCSAWERAEQALTQLEERARSHPVAEGWRARMLLAEASASAALEGQYVDSTRLALWESDAADAPADPALALALAILRTQRSLLRAEADAETLLTAEGVLTLAARLAGTTPVLPLLSDDAYAGLRDWLEALELLEHAPALPAAALVLALWHRRAPVRHGGPLGRLLVTVWLWQRRKLAHPLLPLARGFRESLADYRPFENPARWLPLFLDALARGAQHGLRELTALQHSRARLLGHCQGHRSHSRLDQVAALLLEQPALSPGEAARRLGMSRRGALLLLDELVRHGAAEEVSGRERFRVYRAVR